MAEQGQDAAGRDMERLIAGLQRRFSDVSEASFVRDLVDVEMSRLAAARIRHFALMLVKRRVLAVLSQLRPGRTDRDEPTQEVHHASEHR